MNSRRLFWSVLIILIFCGLASFFFVKSQLDASGLHSDKAVFGGVSLRLEYALTEAERERGLGGRATLPDDYGMLFVFPHDDYYAFWMKDTLVPLDIFWLDDKGQVVYIAHDVATSSYPNVFKPTIPARYVLETRSGFTKDHHILIGTSLLLQKFPTVLK